MDCYQHDLALIHARAYGGYADYCAPDILPLLEPVRGGLMLEPGCGAGALIITEFGGLAPDKIVRDVTTFVTDGHGTWRRGRDCHENVLVDTSLIPARLASCGVVATVETSSGAAEVPPGLRVVTGAKAGL